MESKDGTTTVVSAAPPAVAAQTTLSAARRVAMDPQPDYFRVNVAIRECRELSGSGDVVDLSPYVEVTVAGQKKVTKTMSKTADPNFDHTMNFDFPSIAPAALFEQLILLEVKHDGWFSNSEIGSFKFDIGNVYSQPGHQYANQWVELNHSKRNDGATGYMQVTISVLGSGERAPVALDNDEDPENFAMDPRVLRLNKSTGAPHTMWVRIYAAESLPKMDPSQLRVLQTGLSSIVKPFSSMFGSSEPDSEQRPYKAGDCDPYIKCSFGGQRFCTPTQDNTQDPYWKDDKGATLEFPVDLPSTVTTFKIEAYDSDGSLPGNSDDIIGTARIDVNGISHGGRIGYGPTFGPAWVNLWGQPRTFSFTPSFAQSEHMTRMSYGLTEGCDYRGRVCLEISTGPAGGKAAKSMFRSADEVFADLDNANIPYVCRVEVLNCTMIDRRFKGAKSVTVEALMNPVDWDDEFAVSEPFEAEVGDRNSQDDPVYIAVHSRPTNLEVVLEANRDAEVDYWAYNVKRSLIRDMDSEIAKCGAGTDDQAIERALAAIDKRVAAEVVELEDMSRARPPSTALGKRSLKVWTATLTDASSQLTSYVEANAMAKRGGSKKNDKNNKNNNNNKRKNGGKHRVDDDDNQSDIPALVRSEDGSRGRGGSSSTSNRPKPLRGIRLLERLCVIREALRALVVKPVHQHVPDLVVRLVADSTIVGYVRIPPEDIIHEHSSPEERGPKCDEACSYVLRPLEEPKKTDAEIPALVQLRCIFGARESTPDWMQPRHSAAGSYYQLRCYIYQAEGLLSADEADESDIFFRVTCSTRAGRTPVVPDQNDPQHDFTVVLGSVFVPDGVATDRNPGGEAPPEVMIEAFDEDDGLFGKSSDFLGRTHFTPKVREPGDKPVTLAYHDVYWHGEKFGRVLAAAELIHEDDVREIPISEDRNVPSDIAPPTRMYKVIIRPLGLRNLKPASMMSSEKPHVRLEIAGSGAVDTGRVVSMKSYPNFEALPAEEGASALPPGNIEMLCRLPVPKAADLAPRLTFKVIETRTFGSTEIVGRGTVDIRAQIRNAGRLAGKGGRSKGGKDQQGKGGSRFDSGPSPDPLVTVPGARDAGPERRLVCRHENARERDLAHGAGFRYPSFRKAPNDKSAGPTGPYRLAYEAEHLKHPRKKHEWWSKFMCSSSDLDEHEPDYEGPLLRHYDRELESVFPDMSTMIATHPVMRGNESKDEAEEVGQLVMGVAVFPSDVQVTGGDLPWSSRNVDKPVPVIVRVYVARALELRSTDEETLLTEGSASDPYVCVKIGNRSLNNRSDYQQNTDNPDFGVMFELEATIPRDTLLTVQIIDQDPGMALLGTDDLIGETKIDIETRFLSERNAACGVAECHPEWRSSWRDSRSPTQLLEEWASFHNLAPPTFDSNNSKGIENRWRLTLELPAGGTVHVIESDVPWLWDPSNPAKKSDAKANEAFFKDSLALHAIHEHTNLMAEYVERRALFKPKHGNLVQGYVDMWVDIFEVPTDESGAAAGAAAAVVDALGKSTEAGLIPEPQGQVRKRRKEASAAAIRSRPAMQIPDPIHFPPRKPIDYELRVIVHRVQDVIPDEESLIGGQKMSDIFVRLFILDHANRPMYQQDTDVHYRSLNGEGLFNWRMKFPLRYHPSRKRLVWEDGGVVARMTGTMETRLGPSVLVVQLWDADTLSPSDFLGYARVDLTKIPTKKNDQKRKASAAASVNLFERHATPNTTAAVVRTWVRCHGKYDPTKLQDPPGCLKRLCCRCNCLCCKDMTRYDSDTDDDFMAEEKALPWEGDREAKERMEKRAHRVGPEHANRTGKKPKRMMTGRAELEFELLSVQEAREKPAGVAHEGPLPLAEPIRPKDSFYALTSPLKSLYYVVWTNHWKKLLFLIFIAVVIALCWTALNTYPEIFAQRTADWFCFNKCDADDISALVSRLTNATATATPTTNTTTA